MTNPTEDDGGERHKSRPEALLNTPPAPIALQVPTMKTFTASITFFATLALLAASSTLTNAASIAKREFSGDATYYFQYGTPGSCQVVHADTDIIVALSATQMSTDLCGRTIRVSRPGYADIYPTVADTCPGCGYGSIDLSKGAFDLIGNEAEGRIQVTWDFV